eukprot:SAG22_NODE_3442_length_1709_cov_1.330435_1_plen_160_part_10
MPCDPLRTTRFVTESKCDRGGAVLLRLRANPKLLPHALFLLAHPLVPALRRAPGVREHCLQVGGEQQPEQQVEDDEVERRRQPAEETSRRSPGRPPGRRCCICAGRIAAAAAGGCARIRPAASTARRQPEAAADQRLVRVDVEQPAAASGQAALARRLDG